MLSVCALHTQKNVVDIPINMFFIVFIIIKFNAVGQLFGKLQVICRKQKRKFTKKQNKATQSGSLAI